MSKSPEAPRYHPSFDLDAHPKPPVERRSTWLDGFIPLRSVITIKLETPLGVEDGMTKRQKRVEKELVGAFLRTKGNPSLDRERLQHLTEAYRRLIYIPLSMRRGQAINIPTSTAAGLSLLRDEFEIDLPPYKVIPEEE